MRTWLWTGIIFSGAMLMTFSIGMNWVMRPWIAFGFVLFCPGLALVRFMRLPNLLTELGLAVAVSLGIIVIGLEFMLYLHHWSPVTALYLLIALCYISAALQIGATLRHFITHARSVK